MEVRRWNFSITSLRNGREVQIVWQSRLGRDNNERGNYMGSSIMHGDL